MEAVYARPSDRDAIGRVAADASVPFAGLWLDAPEQTLVARVAALCPSYERHPATPAEAREILGLRLTEDTN